MRIDRLADLLGYSGGMERASDGFFPYVDHIGPATLLCSDGSVMGTLRMPGAPFSLVLNRERNGHGRRLVAFLNAAADENVEVHIHLVKHDATLPPISHGTASAPYARMLLDDYHASIQDDLAVVDWFLTVRVKPRKAPFASVTDKVRDALAKAGLGRASHAADPLLEVQLEDAMRLALATLQPFGPVRLGTRIERDPITGEEALAFSEIAEFLYLLRTTQFSPQPLADVCGFLGAGIAAVDVTAVARKRMLRIDHAAGGSPASQTWAAVLGLLTYPRRLDQSRLDDLLALPGRFVMTVAMRFQSRAEVQDSLDLLRRQLVAGNNRAVSDTAALNDAIDAVAGGRAESGVSRWSLVVHGTTPVEVDRLVSAARNVIANTGAKVGLEGKGMLNAFLAQLPAAPLSTWIRPARCSTKQVAMLATLAGYPRGPAKARWDHHLFRLVSPAGTAYDHDLFVGDVGHNFLGGPNGGGKTVWLGMNIAALDGAVSRKGGTQIVLDVDESNHNTILALGGRYSTLQVGRSGIAPLRGLPDTPRVRAFLRDLVAGLVQTDEAPAPNKAERDGIRQGVDFVMGEMEPHERSFGTIRSFMGFEEHGAGERLEPWCEGGELGWVFDGDEHLVDFNTRLVGVDLTAVMNDARVMPPIALTLLWMASDVIDGRRVVIWCEEAPAYMPTPAFSKPFKGIALRARKRNASFNKVPQAISSTILSSAGVQTSSSATIAQQFDKVSIASDAVTAAIVAKQTSFSISSLVNYLSAQAANGGIQFLLSCIAAIWLLGQTLLAIILCFGPLLLGFELFDRTRGWVDQWIGKLVGITAFGIGTSILLGIQMQGLLTLFRTVNGNIPTSGAEAVAVLMRICGNVVMDLFTMGALPMICAYGSGVAASLAAPAVMPQRAAAAAARAAASAAASGRGSAPAARPANSINRI